MNDKTQEAFDAAMADVFEGRDSQLGYGSRKILREFYDRALKDAIPTPTSSKNSSVVRGTPVPNFQDLKVGDVFQNDHLQGEARCRRVIALINPNKIETEVVSTRTKRVVRTEVYYRKSFDSFVPYYYIQDPR